MNQIRAPANTLLRRCVPRGAGAMVRPTLLTVTTRCPHMRANAWTSWGALLKQTADHGAEILVLFMYFTMACILLAYHMIYVSLFKKNEIILLPNNKDYNEIYNGNLDWTDPRGQKTMGPLCRRHVIFFENKLGWKDDVKDLLNEIYAFSKPGYQAAPIAIPSEFAGISRSMILQEDSQKSTELMRSALREVLAEQ
jgi:hypothetical protein